MKILLFSDNHGDREAVKTLVNKHPKVDYIISLGDSEMRESELTELNIFGVKGNYPFEPKFPKELSLVFEGVKVYFTHGHNHSVKLGYKRILNHAIYNHYEVVCFGHTHHPLLLDTEGIILINPGSLSSSRSYGQQTYAILEITDKEINIYIRSLKHYKILYNLTKIR